MYTPPAVGLDGTVYVAGGNPNPKLYALTPEGVEIWQIDLGPSYLGGSPAIAADGTIYLGADKTFRAYDSNGRLRWSYSFPATTWAYYVSAPAIAHDGTIYVGTGSPDRSLYALHPDGSLLWKFPASGLFADVYTPVIGKDGTVYFGSYNDGFYALNPDGTRRWYYPMQGHRISAAIGSDGTVYVVGSAWPSKLYAFTPEGVKKWETQIGSESSQGASAPVIGSDGTIFIRNDFDLTIHAFNADGSTKWSFAPGGNIGGESTSPAVDSQGNVYSGSGVGFFAVSATGSLLWSHKTDGGFTGSALTREGILYVGSAAGSFYAFRANAVLGQDPWPMFQRDLRHTGAAPLGAVTNLPVVSVEAAIPLVRENLRNLRSHPPSTNTGRFNITRAGGSSNALTVQYSLSGTASNGVDYVPLSGTALFPAGIRSTEVVVAPVDDKLVEGDETVVLTLTPDSTYHVGMSNRAVVTIHDSHDVPTATMIAPANGAVVPAGTNIVLGANALGGDGFIAKVEFFEGERNLGIANGPLRTPDGMYLLTWSNVPPGLYAVRARATDNAGAHAFSEPISLIVLAPTNIAPPGTILWQLEIGAVYHGPAVAEDGTIYVVAGNAPGRLYAITPGGVKKWETDLGLYAGSAAVAADGTIYVTGDKALKAFHPDGTVRWSSALPNTQLFYNVSPPAIAHDGTVYVGAGTAAKGLYAFRPDGTLRWRFVPDGAFAEVYAPVVGGDGTVYFGSYDDGFYAVNPDGTRRWYVAMRGYGLSGAIGGDGTVYVVGSVSPSTLFAFTPDGQKRWQTQIGPQSSQGASPPAIGADGSIFIRSDHDLKVYAFNPGGSTKWVFASGGNIGSGSTSPAVDSQGNVYSGSGVGFFAVSPTGSLLWSYKTNGMFTASALTREGILYVGSAAGSFYAFRANAGLGDDPWPMFQRDLRRTGAVPPLDADGDGVPNDRDQCPATPSGTVVNAQGCSIAQLCPCDGNWQNHGEYVRCVIEHAWDFYRAGLIDGAKRKAIVAAAARSDCGGRARSREPVLLLSARQTREEFQREGMRIVVAGEAEGPCVVEVSNDLIHWKPLAGEALIGDEITLPLSSGVQATFYRVRVSP